MVKKLDVSNLIIEITRRCNMNCAHCLRGEAEDVDFDFTHLKSVFEKISVIHDFVISGGEPSLNLKGIRQLLDIIVESDVEIKSFFIATNATSIDKEFFHLLLDYKIISETFFIRVSDDMYHRYNKKELYQKVFGECVEISTWADNRTLINQGNAKDLDARKSNVYPEPIEIYENEEKIICESTFYFNCEGKVVNNCNYDYENQRDDFSIFSDIEDFYETCINNIKK